MKTIVIASKNPVKISAVRHAAGKMLGTHWEIVASSGASGVSDQPMTSRETLLGSRNRVADVRIKHPEADLWVGIEGGVEDDDLGLAAFAWVVVESPLRTGTGRSASFYLPEAIACLVRQGVELGEADDRIFGRTNSKQQDGAIGILSAGALDRAGLYEHAVIAALLAIVNPQLYPPVND
jgi:inosine/xanthosine triphosphatase